MEGVLKRPTEPDGHRRLVSAGVMTVHVALAGGLLARYLRHRRARRSRGDRRRFEALGTDLSTTILESPAADLDRRIARALQQTLAALGVDRANLLEVTGDGRGGPVTHAAARPAVAPLPAAFSTQYLPWTAARLARGEVTSFARIEDLPAEALADRAAYQALGVASAAVVPVPAAGAVRGALPALVLSTVAREHRWPDNLGVCLRPLAQTFATALLRRRAEALAGDNAALGDALAHAHRVQTVGAMAGALAHEVTQPLTAIAANAEVVGRAAVGNRPLDDERLRAALADIGHDAQRAVVVLDHYRALLRRERDAPRRIDVNALIEAVVRLVHHERGMHDVPLHLRLALDVPPVQGDAVQLQQVVLNLTLNACQSLATAGRRPGAVAIESARGEHGGALVTVRDVGPGVPPADLERIFEPFVTTKPGHLGLGLSISRSIVHAHGGRIRATSIPGAGLTVHVELPPADALAPQ
jgi:signal transduction histidine kinase